MSIALVPLNDMERMACAIVTSDLFGMKTKEQVLALMLIAQAEGRHPAIVARDYDIIQGRPAKKAEAMLRDFLDAGGSVEWHRLDDECADATFSHAQGGAARIAWDTARAKKAGLASKDMYHKYTRQMLRSRTVSEGCRTVYPAATSGLYEPSEVRQITIEDSGIQDPATPHTATGGATIDDLIAKKSQEQTPANRTDDLAKELKSQFPDGQHGTGAKGPATKRTTSPEETRQYVLGKVQEARNATDVAEGEALLAKIRAGLPKLKLLTPSAREEINVAIADADNALAIGATLTEETADPLASEAAQTEVDETEHIILTAAIPAIQIEANAEDLRDTVERYRHEGKLNHEAVKRINEAIDKRVESLKKKNGGTK